MEKVVQVDCLKVKLLPNKDFIDEVKRQTAGWVEIRAVHKTNRRLVLIK